MSDVSTTGNGAGDLPQATIAAEEDDWTQAPHVQREDGYLGGVCLGIVPVAGLGEQLLEAGDVLDHGSPAAQLGMAIGQVVGGLVSLALGVAGEIGGGAATVTGIGAALGVPAIVVSTAIVVGGLANIGAGIRGPSRVR
jgi:hypothetical protein